MSLTFSTALEDWYPRIKRSRKQKRLITGGHKLPSKAVNGHDSKVKHNCAKCELLPCINFHRKGEENFEGGELYVLEQLIKKKVVFPCNVGDVVYTLCQIWSNLGTAFPSSVIFYQCIRDLRASAYLLLSCHYRSSIQLIDPL